MQNQPNAAAIEDDQIDSSILSLLLGSDGPDIWSIHDIGREIEDDVNAQDGVARLHAAGLLYRWGDFVMASRAAWRSYELER